MLGRAEPGSASGLGIWATEPGWGGRRVALDNGPGLNFQAGQVHQAGYCTPLEPSGAAPAIEEVEEVEEVEMMPEEAVPAAWGEGTGEA